MKWNHKDRINGLKESNVIVLSFFDFCAMN